MTQKPQGQPVPRYLGGDGHNIAPESEWPKHGVTDLTNAVDQRSKAVLAAEEFSASQCRVQQLKNQLLAEQDRLTELCRQVNDAMDEAIKEAGK